MRYIEWWTWSGSNAEWVGAVAALIGAVAAFVLGLLTLNNNKRSRDNQERATLTAAEEPVSVSPVSDNPSGDSATVDSEVEKKTSDGDEPAAAPRTTRDWSNDLVLQSILLLAQQQERVRFSIDRFGGESWRLVNEGKEAAYGVEIAGLTELDKRRLTHHGPTPADIGPGEFLMFSLVSRLMFSGPANLVVNYALEPGGPRARKVLLVPAE